MNLNNGTDNNPPTPTMNTRFIFEDSPLDSCLVSSVTSLPFNMKLSIAAGTAIDAKEGRNKDFITPEVLILPFTQSMMVVTSPMGENAPPLFAASITIDEYMSLSEVSLTTLFNTMTITMAVVMLSSTAERKNVKIVSFHNSPVFDRDFRLFLTKLNPPFASTTSTIAIAPSRKKRISEVSPRALVKADEFS